MIQWKPFIFQGQVHDLSHLHPKMVDYSHKSKNSEQIYHCSVQVIYGLHCFTRGKKAEETIDQALCYKDKREVRIFDFTRYELSKQLPEIIAKLLKSHCYHTGKGNFCVVEIMQSDGKTQEYEVYFQPSRSSKDVLTLYIQSAYMRDGKYSQIRPKRKKIDFHVVLLNTLTRKPIKMPK